jgi:Photosynthesis system II assembly factor YCF48
MKAVILGCLVAGSHSFVSNPMRARTSTASTRSALFPCHCTYCNHFIFQSFNPNLFCAFFASSIRQSTGPGEIDAKATSEKDGLRNGMQSIANLGGVALGVTSAALLAAMPSVANAKEEKKKTWVKVELPIRETLFDISFDPSKPEHGWLVGAKGTFLETFDNGDTWAPRSFSNLDEDEEINYRFEVASISENEGWIIGKPAIMLHTRDGGKQFERIPVSPKLPGEPTSIKATGLSKAEMITSQGAVYTTVNGGLNWKAQVKETIDATLNRVSSSGTSGASFFTGKIANQVSEFCQEINLKCDYH